MITKYKKKPVIIEAIQLKGDSKTIMRKEKRGGYVGSALAGYNKGE